MNNKLFNPPSSLYCTDTHYSFLSIIVLLVLWSQLLIIMVLLHTTDYDLHTTHYSMHAIFQWYVFVSKCVNISDYHDTKENQYHSISMIAYVL